MVWIASLAACRYVGLSSVIAAASLPVLVAAEFLSPVGMDFPLAVVAFQSPVETEKLVANLSEFLLVENL